jgi:hypothetical protein
MLLSWSCSWLICWTWLLISVTSFRTCRMVWIRLAMSMTGMPCARAPLVPRLPATDSGGSGLETGLHGLLLQRVEVTLGAQCGELVGGGSHRAVSLGGPRRRHRRPWFLRRDQWPRLLRPWPGLRRMAGRHRRGRRHRRRPPHLRPGGGRAQARDHHGVLDHLDALLDCGTAGEGGGEARGLEADDGHEDHHDAVLVALADRTLNVGPRKPPLSWMPWTMACPM